MQILIKIPTGFIQEIEYLTFSYIHGSWLFILWFHCGLCNKKGTFRVFTGFGHLQTSEIVEFDSRHSLFPKTGWENEDLTLILRETNGNFCRYKCFQCWCKGEKTREQRKLQLLKIKNLQHKTSFLTCIYIFPLVTYKDFYFYGKYA